MNQPTANASNAQSVLNSVISASKAGMRKVEAEAIQRFIASRPDVTGPVQIQVAPSAAEVGASSGIVIFTARYDLGAGPVTRELVLRHAPGSEIRVFFEYDLARQFQVQRAMQGSGVPVPEPLWLDAEGEHLGLPGYVMAAVSGTAPNPSAFVKGPLAEASAADRQSMLNQIMQAQVGIHQLDYAEKGLSNFVMNADGASPLQKGVNWYWQTWEWINNADYARLVPVRRWLLDNAPVGGTTLTHGDSTLHNYLFQSKQLTAVLDWEMSSLGRPESDLALQCVGNELFAAPADSGLLQPPTQAEWLAMYEKAGGRKVEQFDYFKKFTAYMILIAVQSLQRNVTEDVRAAQQPFANRLWAMIES